MLDQLADVPVGFPEWNQRDIEYKDGRDPLGLETISTDQILPRILPGWVANTRRPRYLSFYLFLLQDFHDRQRGSTQRELGEFIRRSEFELALGVLRHTTGNHCGRDADGVGGSIRARRVLNSQVPTTERMASIPSSGNGAYGQFGYRGVLVELGLVAPVGEVVDGAPLAYDRLISDRAREIARLYGETVMHTRWYREYLGMESPLPIDVMDDVAERGCLCRLAARTEERDALLGAMTTPGGDDATERARALRRRQAIAVLLSSIASDPAAATDSSALRKAMWSLGGTAPPGTNSPLESWAALVAKEYYASLVGVAWHHINQIGAGGPMNGWAEPALLGDIRASASGHVACLGRQIEGAAPLGAVVSALVDATRDMHLEEVIEVARSDASVAAALAGMLVLRERLVAVDAAPWAQLLSLDTWAQSSVRTTLRRLGEQLDRPFCDVAVWLAQHLVLRPHEDLATAKLGWYEPPMHSFRFRHERGFVRFFRDRDSSDRGVIAPRFGALQTLTRDLGLWSRVDEGGAVTPDGLALLDAVHEQ